MSIKWPQAWNVMWMWGCHYFGPQSHLWPRQTFLSWEEGQPCLWSFFSIFRPRVLVLAQETQLLPWNTIYHLLLLTNSKTLERLSSLCINSLLLRNKVSPNWVASNNAYLLSHSFWEPGMMPDIDIWRLDWDWGMRFQDGAWTWLLAGGFWSHHTALSPWDGS